MKLQSLKLHLLSDLSALKLQSLKQRLFQVHVISRVSPNIRFLDTIGDEYYTVNGEQDFVFNVNVTGNIPLHWLEGKFTKYIDTLHKDIYRGWTCRVVLPDG